MTRLVSSFRTAKENIVHYRAFINGHPDLYDRLSKHRAWYAVKENGRWHFGNSKVIGYSNLTPEAYLSEDHDGRQTEAVLQKWFGEVGPEHPLHDELWEALGGFLADYGKSPSKLARINVPVSEVATSEGDHDDAICNLIIEVARGLDSERIKKVRKHLKALL